MKFKTIFLAFNILLIVSFVFIFFMPFFLFGWDYLGIFWRDSWYLPLGFALVLCVADTWFAKNWKLFLLIEKEDWAGLRDYLENRIYVQGKASSRSVRFLINACVVLPDIAALRRLALHLKEKSPLEFVRFGLELGLPFFQENNAEGMKAHFGALAENPRSPKRDWALWILSFARLASGEADLAREELVRLSRKEEDPLLGLLAAYLLLSYSGEEASRAAQAGQALKEKYPSRSLWTPVIEEARKNLVVLVLGKLVEDALSWLYADETA
ncbi:MAG: hypothetical protein LBC67_05800 [Spirochaetales bacterium]|nr:hypothetical protein [Spirochaetales bacterium]